MPTFGKYNRSVQNADLDMDSFGSVLRRLREAKGWTRYRLASRVDISDVYLTQIESGRSKRVGVNIVAKLAYALGITVDELLAELGMKTTAVGHVPLDLMAAYRDLDEPMRQAFVKIGAILLEAQGERSLPVVVQDMAAFDERDVERHVAEESEPWPG